MAALIMNNKDLLYVIKPEEQNESTLRELLTLHPEIQFVSLMGVDFAGNDTDEKSRCRFSSRISMAFWQAAQHRLTVLPLC